MKLQLIYCDLGLSRVTFYSTNHHEPPRRPLGLLRLHTPQKDGLCLRTSHEQRATRNGCTGSGSAPTTQIEPRTQEQRVHQYCHLKCPGLSCEVRVLLVEGLCGATDCGPLWRSAAEVFQKRVARLRSVRRDWLRAPVAQFKTILSSFRQAGVSTES